MALTNTSVVSGVGGYCALLRERVVRADTIVVGRTVHHESEEARPGRYTATYEFRVSSVLKGNRYKAGDLIVRRYEHLELLGYPSFPSIETEPHIVFVNLYNDDKEWFGCTEPAEDATVKSVRRQIEVLENPPLFFSSNDEQDIVTVVDWIRRTYINYEGALEPRADWSGTARADREAIVQYLLGHAASKNADISVEALGVLVWIRAGEAFDVFAEVLDSNDDGQVSLGAQGLKHLGDERAVPLLIDRLQRLRTGNEERRPRHRGWGLGARRWSPEGELMGAISSFNDPRATRFLLDSLDNGDHGQALWGLAHQKHPRAVDPLLRLTWSGDSHDAADALAGYEDERILEQARVRMYDHPLAPYLLATRGDPEAKAFMIRLIEQGHYAGARWAGVTRDQSAKAALIRSLNYYHEDHMHFDKVAYALGRMRAFDLIPGLLAEISQIDPWTIAAYFVWGLADRPWGGEDGCRGSAYYGCLRVSLRETAARERWSRENVRLVDELADAVEHPPHVRDHYSIYDSWSPPAALPDMPDPLNTEATSFYLERNHERCQQVLRDGPVEDQDKVLQAARHNKVNILDADLALTFLNGPDWTTRGQVLSALSGGELTLSIEEIKRWALPGNFVSTRSALNYFFRHPKPEYAPIVTKILYQGRYLFEETLFKAIIETNAIGCADLLRAYLENEHFTLRFNAAVALVHLGDDRGRIVLAELEPDRRGCSGCIGGDYVRTALEQIR
jgi:HEAT repeat protein